MYCNEHNLQTNDFHVCVIYRFVTCGQGLQNFTQSSHLRYALQLIWCRILFQVCILAQLFSSCYFSHGSNGRVSELVQCCLESTMQWWALTQYWFFIPGMQASVKATNYTYTVLPSVVFSPLIGFFFTTHSITFHKYFCCSHFFYDKLYVYAKFVLIVFLLYFQLNREV